MTASSQPNESASPSPEVTETPDPFLSLKRGGTEVYLIRHGDALPGVEEIVLGDYDDQGLSALGRRQAQALVPSLRESGLAAIYSSPIGRAMETAAPTAQALGLDIQVDPELREVELGPVGADLRSIADRERLAQAMRERQDEIANIIVTSGYWSAIGESEPSAALRGRMRAALARIAARHPGERVAVFSHGGSINAYIGEMLGIARDYFFPCANTSISVVRLKGERRLLLALNDVHHLRQANLFDVPR